MYKIYALFQSAMTRGQSHKVPPWTWRLSTRCLRRGINECFVPSTNSAGSYVWSPSVFTSPWNREYCLSLSQISRKLKFKEIKLYLQSNTSAKCQKLAWELDLLDTRDCVPVHYSMLLQEILSDPLPPVPWLPSSFPPPPFQLWPKLAL